MSSADINACGVVLSHVPADGSITSEREMFQGARADGLSVEQAHAAFTVLILENVLQHGRNGGLQWVCRALGRAPPKPQRPGPLPVRKTRQR